MFKDQAQHASDGSTAIQAGGSVVINNITGVSASEVRQIALDVMNDNLLRYSGLAMELARARGAEITDKFLERLQVENPTGIQQAQSPSFQDALFTVQKEYAKAGDVSLGDLLVNLLVDRTKHEQRDVLQLVLSEALRTAPKLTSSQINTLSFIFFFQYCRFGRIADIRQLGDHYRKHLEPIAADIATSPISFRHFEFTGCGSSISPAGSGALERLWRQQYAAFFKEGFDKARLDLAELQPSTVEALIMRAFNDPSKFQIAALNSEDLNSMIMNLASGFVGDEARRLRELFFEGDQDDTRVRDAVVSVAPFLEPVIGAWVRSEMHRFSLTSVGMAIGHANIKRFAPDFAPLSVWINESIEVV